MNKLPGFSYLCSRRSTSW